MQYSTQVYGQLKLLSASVAGQSARSHQESRASVVVSITNSTAGTSFTTDAIVKGSLWFAHLDPHEAGGDFNITVMCTKGCTNNVSSVLEHVTFGDVYV